MYFNPNQPPIIFPPFHDIEQIFVEENFSPYQVLLINTETCSVISIEGLATRIETLHFLCHSD